MHAAARLLLPLLLVSRGSTAAAGACLSNAALHLTPVSCELPLIRQTAAGRAEAGDLAVERAEGLCVGPGNVSGL
jgi:hypothetical protein